jgi:hypothetical protein
MARLAASSGRPDFSRDGAALYFNGGDGIHRVELATHEDRLVLAGARAYTGIGISPDGKRLAYAECNQHIQLVDVTKPAAPIVDDDETTQPMFGAGGQLAWVHQGKAGDQLLLRRKDGTIVELVPPTFGHISGLAFDSTGGRITFTAAGDHPGIHVVDTDPRSSSIGIQQLTDDPTDFNPRFTLDRRIVFTRTDDRAVSHIFAVGVDGGAAKQTSPGSREVRAGDPATGRVLIDLGERVVWWDPVTDRLGAPLSGPDAAVRDIAVSPNGRWWMLQTGVAGLTIWRGPTGHTEQLQKIADFPGDYTLDSATIDDDGRVIAPVSRWSGELQIVDAAPGVTL